MKWVPLHVREALRVVREHGLTKEAEVLEEWIDNDTFDKGYEMGVRHQKEREAEEQSERVPNQEAIALRAIQRYLNEGYEGTPNLSALRTVVSMAERPRRRRPGT